MSLMKTNVPGYMKDDKSKMVVNTNQEEYNHYLDMRNQIIKERELAAKINTLEEKMESIESVLTQILKKVS